MNVANLEKMVSGLESKTIPGRDGPYLTRYLIEGSLALGTDELYPYPSAFIHHFHTPDQERDLHSHPWPWSQSVVLAGGYTERRARSWVDWRGVARIGQVVTRTYGPGDTNRFEVGDYHSVDELHGDTWTLFMTGPVDRTWYFWENGKPVHWQEYLRARGLLAA